MDIQDIGIGVKRGLGVSITPQEVSCGPRSLYTARKVTNITQTERKVMDEYIVKTKVICTQTVKVKAENEDDASEKAAAGEGEIVTNYDYYEVYKQEDWEITLAI